MYYSRNSLTTVTIEEGLTSIGKFTFYECAALKTITFPESVTRIGTCAFEGCGLTSICFTTSITNIGNSAFEDCNNLTSICLTPSITNIDSNAFSYCNNLNTIYWNSTSIPVTTTPGWLKYASNDIVIFHCNGGKITGPALGKGDVTLTGFTVTPPAG